MNFNYDRFAYSSIDKFVTNSMEKTQNVSTHSINSYSFKDLLALNFSSDRKFYNLIVFTKTNTFRN